jgi:pimeloyl-ACP methyl ester carboxylesterase
VQSLAVRSRRAYFDCRHGQLHVRTAFPATGGFDEQVTLLCLHPDDATGRVFASLLPLAAAARSVYAPDLPGCGESDAAAAGGKLTADAAAAVADLAADLRLREVDVLGLHGGAAVAVELALARPGLVRALVLVGVEPAARLALLEKQSPRPHVSLLAADEFPAALPAAAATALVTRLHAILDRLPARPAR